MTHAQYLAALVELHRAARERADRGDDELRRGGAAESFRNDF
jgi:hypothetical protein